MHRGHPVISGIAKQPVPPGTDELWLSSTGLEGDGQADLVDHGGRDKAVYAYPSEHLPAWATDLDQPDLGPAPFGENLSTAGWREEDVCIGDRWRWGDALLEVCQPRWPCYKLAIHRRRGDIAGLLKGAGRTGWYLRVLEEGAVPVAGPIAVVEQHPAGVTVFAVHDAARPGHGSPEAIEEALAVAALADEWRGMLIRRL
jgi:MOSC domain-containing protein YiiM